MINVSLHDANQYQIFAIFHISDFGERETAIALFLLLGEIFIFLMNFGIDKLPYKFVELCEKTLKLKMEVLMIIQIITSELFQSHEHL